jgi:amidohydrolase
MAEKEAASIDVLINQYAEEIEERLIAWRRDIHEHPELGNQEFRTSKIVADHLKAIGVDEVYDGLGGATGVIAIIRGATDGPTVGLRADMDALPVKEETGLPFASKATSQWGEQGLVPVMHACGHDTHTAMLMATAEVLVRLRSRLCGKVVLIFQPAEESFSSDWVGKSGAAAMIEEDIYLKNKPDAVFALHIGISNEVGSAGRVFFTPGISSYCMSIMRLTVHGKGGHGARPWVGIDAIVIGAQVLLGLQTIISRNIDIYSNNATLSVGAMHGGTKFNVIADTLTMDGALRFTDRSARAYLEGRVEETARHIAESAGGTAEVQWTWVPALYNDPDLIEKAIPKLKETIGADNVRSVDQTPGLDDFSHFGELSPSLFVWMSVDPDETDGSEIPNLHTSKMVVNERALVNGVKAMTSFAVKFGAD